MAIREIRRAVVTGGAGFLGSHVCEELLGRGVSVVCMDSFLTSGPHNISHLFTRGDFQLVQCDLTSFVHVSGPVDLVMHMASAASPADYLRYPVETLRVGSAGTAHALGLARAKGARFVLASTSEVYGDPLVHPQPETYWGNVNPVGPRSVYDEAKRYAEALTTAYREARGVDTAIARIFNSFGPRMRPDDGRAIPTFIRQALDGDPLTVAGDGSQTRSVCYVDDTVTGLLALAYSDFPGPVNIGSAREHSILDLAGMVRDTAGVSCPLIFVDRPQDDPGVRCPDMTLAHERLHWWPKVEIKDGLRSTIDWFAQLLSERRRAIAAS